MTDSLDNDYEDLDEHGICKNRDDPKCDECIMNQEGNCMQVAFIISAKGRVIDPENLVTRLETKKDWIEIGEDSGRQLRLLCESCNAYFWVEKEWKDPVCCPYCGHKKDVRSD